MDVQGGREREEGQAAWSPWRGVEELIWSKDTGLRGRRPWDCGAVPSSLRSLLLSEPMSYGRGLPSPPGHGLQQSSLFGGQPHSLGC